MQNNTQIWTSTTHNFIDSFNFLLFTFLDIISTISKCCLNCVKCQFKVKHWYLFWHNYIRLRICRLVKLTSIYLLYWCIFWDRGELLADSWARSCWGRCHPKRDIRTCPGGSRRGGCASGQCWLKKPLDILKKKQYIIWIWNVTSDCYKIFLVKRHSLYIWILILSEAFSM